MLKMHMIGWLLQEITTVFAKAMIAAAAATNLHVLCIYSWYLRPLCYSLFDCLYDWVCFPPAQKDTCQTV